MSYSCVVRAEHLQIQMYGAAVTFGIKQTVKAEQDKV